MKQYLKLLNICFVLYCIFCASNLEAQNTVSIDSLLRNSDNSSTESELIDKLNKVSHSLWAKNPEVSMELAEEALDRSREIEYKQGIAGALKNIGILHRRAGKLGEALVYLKESLELFTELGNNNEVIDLHVGMSTIYRNMGDLEEAMDLLLKGTRIAREHNPDELLRLSGSIGKLMHTRGEYQEAKKYYLEVDEVLQKMQQENRLDSLFLIWNYSDLGIVNAELGDFAKGAEYLKICENYHKTHNNTLDIADLYSDWGEFYRLKAQPAKALSYQLKAAKVYEEKDKIRRLAGINHRLGRTYLEISDYKRSVNHLTLGKELAIKADNLELQEKIENQLSQVYEQMGNNALALSHLKDYLAISKKIFNENKAKVIEDKKAIYETETKQHQIEMLQKDMKIKDAENNLKTTQLYGAIGGGIFILVFSMILLALYERRRRDQQLILAQNEEIMDHQDEILSQKDELIQAKDEIHRQKIVEYEQKKQLEVNRALIEGEEKERERLAGELHDQVGSMLSTVKLHLQALESRVEQLNEETTKQFEFTNDLLDKACQTVRNLSHEVSSGMVNRYGLVVALEELVANNSAGAPFEINLVVFDLEERLEKEIELNLYRIIQELLNNIIKYAEPEEVTISVTRHEDSLNIMVEDDGKGFDVEEALARGGLGFRNIETRLNKIGGDWHLDSAIGMGTTVTIDTPIVFA